MIHDLLTKFKKPSVLAEGFLFFILISIFSCATNTPLQDEALSQDLTQTSYLPSESEINWQRIQNTDWGEYFFFENKNYPIRYHCIKINLASEKISMLTFPASKNDFTHKKGIKTDFFKGITAEEFSEKFSPIISVNAAPYTGSSRFTTINMLSSKRKIVGVHIVNKIFLSKPVKKYSAIAFKKENSGFSGKIFRNQNGQDFLEYDFTFGGFFTILKDFKKQEFPQKTNDSRTALGLSEDGKTLYILTVEGEISSKSKGLSYQECAEIMLSLGAKDAMQMDGGDSTSLYINNENSLSYSVRRKNAVFIGFKNKEN